MVERTRFRCAPQRRPWRALGAWLVVAFAIVWPSRAHADVSIQAYTLTVTPRGDAGDSHFALTLVYRVVGEKKVDGFKYVGKRAVANVRAHTLAGTPLHSNASYEPSSGEIKLDFALPPADDHHQQTVVVEFDQRLPLDYAWSGGVGRVDWANQFRVPIDEATLRVLGPLATEGMGLACRGEGEARVCEYSGEAYDKVITRFPTGPGSTAWLVVWGIVAALGATALVVAVSKRKVALLALRGVLPPADEVAYPEVADVGYRAPPPLPVPEEATPVLADADKSSLGFKAVLAFILYAAAQLVVAALVTAPLQIGILLAGVAVLVAIPLMIWISKDEAKGILVLTVAPTTLILAALALHLSGLVLGILLFVCFFIYLMAMGAKVGGGDGSSSSSTSSSSCGGGGGGCGGGGGGGGCGG